MFMLYMPLLMYCLCAFCTAVLLAAVQYLQPTTVLCAAALALLAYNISKPTLVHYYAHLTGKPKAAVASKWDSGEQLLLRQGGRAAVAAGGALCLWGSGVVWLGCRALAGRSFTTTVWVGVSAWMLLLLSELRLFGQVRWGQGVCVASSSGRGDIFI
jgi:hypothetical protein